LRFLDLSEVEQLASETVEPCGTLIRFACPTGLRQGELFALRERAVALERAPIVFHLEGIAEGGGRFRNPRAAACTSSATHARALRNGAFPPAGDRAGCHMSCMQKAASRPPAKKSLQMRWS